MSVYKHPDGYRACINLPGGRQRAKVFARWSSARDWEKEQLATVTPADDADAYLTQEELVVHLKHAVSLGTLRNWRSEHKGPRYVLIGRTVLYPRDKVEAWLNEQTADADRRWDERPW